MPALTTAEMLKYANLQMAAEALYDFNTKKRDPASLIPGEHYVGPIQSNRLTDGNEHASRFTQTEATKFAAQWTVVDHISNTQTGFSGTLLYNEAEKQYVISIRSTEFIDDAARDSVATNNMEIATYGFAFGQIADMEAWYKNLSKPGGPLDGKNYSVTGYSLGGHLATAFNLLRHEDGTANRIKEVVTFNGAGVGQVTAPSGKLGDVMQTFTTLRDSPAQLAMLFQDTRLGALYTALSGRLNGGLTPTSADYALLDTVTVSPQATEAEQQRFATEKSYLKSALDRVVSLKAEVARLATVTDSKDGAPAKIPDSAIAQEGFDYQMAVIWSSESTQAMSKIRGGFNTVFGKTPGTPFLDNQYDVVGRETTTTQTAMVADSQWHHGTNVDLFIEDQPLFRGNGSEQAINDIRKKGTLNLNSEYSNNDFGDTHSLVLIVDSLSVQNLLKTLAPAATQSQIESIFKLASNLRAQSVSGAQGKAEGDVLENVVNALADLFLGPQQKADRLNGSPDGNTWAKTDATFTSTDGKTYTGREALYGRLQAIAGNTAYDTLSKSGALLLEAATGGLASRARTDFGAFAALYSLSPFVLKGENQTLAEAVGSAWQETYSVWNEDRRAHESNDPHHEDSITDAWLTDRAEFLRQKCRFNSANKDPYNPDAVETDGSVMLADAYFEDVASGYKIQQGRLEGSSARRYYFGAQEGDTLTGGNGEDRLYGMLGNDTLDGAAGHDNLEGGLGDDVLIGGTGADTLDGGLGLDTYVFTANEGKDTLKDSDGLGRIMVGGQALSGATYAGYRGVGRYKTWTTADGTTTYTYWPARDGGAKGTLVISGSALGSGEIAIDNFDLDKAKTGYLGLTLEQHIEFQLAKETSNPFDTAGATAQNESLVLDKGAAKALKCYLNTQAKEGDIVKLSLGPGVDPTLFKICTGAETLDFSQGDITLELEAGQTDIAFAFLNDAYAIQSDLALQLTATYQPVAGDAIVNTMAIAIPVAGTGQSTNRDASSDHDDFFDGDDYPVMFQNEAYWGLGGNDVALGLAGDDWLIGDGVEIHNGNTITHAYPDNNPLDGNDFLDGGDGNDLLWGNGGADALYGGAGNDELYGDDANNTTNAGNDYLDGEDGDDLLYGGALNDILYGGAGNDTLIGDAGDTPTALQDDDILDGEDGDDQLHGFGGSDELYGGAGNDTLRGDQDDQNAGNDYLDGEAGDDTLYGGALADTLYGGSGADVLIGDYSDTAAANQGNDTLDGEDGNDRLYGMGGADELYGGAGNDTLVGDDDGNLAVQGNDMLDGEEGDDRLFGLAGDDILIGGAGNDILMGNAGNDTYRFGSGGGQDVIDNDDAATSRMDRLVLDDLGEGDVRVEARNGSDLVVAAKATGDTITVRNYFTGDAAKIDAIMFAGGVVWDRETINGRFEIAGSTGNDTLNAIPDMGSRLNGNEGNDNLNGGAGNDVLDGGADNDYIVGGAGNDILIGGAGTDFLSGGTGNDTYVFARGAGHDAIEVNDVTADRVETLVLGDLTPEDVRLERWEAPTGSTVMAYGLTVVVKDTGESVRVDNYFQGDGNKIDLLTFADGTTWDRATIENSITRYWGAEDDNVLHALGDGSAEMHGQDGNDTLTGNIGDDLLDGGNGNDFLYGVAGNDSLLGWDGDDVLDGGAGDDSLTGWNGNDTLDGGAGNDLLTGGAGSDTYVFRRGAGNDLIDNNDTSAGRIDTLVLEGLSVADIRMEKRAGDLAVIIRDSGEAITIQSHFTYASHRIDAISFPEGLLWNVDQLLGYLGVDIVGGDGDDSLMGAPGVPNRMSGLAGNDGLIGDAGDDILDGGDGNDDLAAADGNDQLSGGAGNDQLNGGAGADLLAGDAGDDVLAGGSGGDSLAGGDGNDALAGDEGDDLLDGGVGNDTLNGGLGNDVYVFRRGAGTDTIDNYDVDTWRADTLHLEGLTPNDVRVERQGDYDLAFVILDTGESIRVQNYFFDDAHKIDAVTFGDGAYWDAAAILANIAVVGTPGDDNLSGVPDIDNRMFGLAGNDTLAGNVANDRLDGGSGDDHLYGFGGDDLLDGGAGNDWLEGGAGSDTYVFRRGGGSDTVFNADGDAGRNDTLLLAGLTTADVVLEKRNNWDLSFAVRDTADAITVKNFVYGDAYRLNTVVFGDGAMFDWTSLLQTLGVSILGTASSNSLFALAGVSSRLYGLEGDDTLTGDSEGDLLDGGAGSDALYGGAGNDTYVFSRGGGFDVIRNNDATVGRSDTLVLEGLNVDDVRVEASGSPSLVFRIKDSGESITVEDFFAADENKIDVVRFADGTSWDLAAIVANVGVYGTDGDDALSALDAGSKVFGLAGNDTLTGGAGSDFLDGSAGNDLLQGGGGADIMLGGDGNDTYLVDDTGDVVTEIAGEGVDGIQSAISWTLGANLENLTLTGTDSLDGSGNGLNNVLTGNSGDNVLDGAGGADTLSGGAGNDTYVVDNAGDVVTENASEGTDTVQSGVTYTLGANVENLALTGTAAIDGTGNTLANTLTGNGADNILDGGAGNDNMSGGAGDDIYVADSASDVVNEAASAGIDTVRSSVTHTLASNVEKLILTGTGAINGTGNALDNTLTGNAGNNSLSGGSGADTMAGGAGNDIYVVDSAGDVVVENAAEGTDTVQSGISYVLGANIEKLTLTGSAAINGTGNDLANTLTGNTGNNILDGGAGNDTLVGGAGNDTYYVSTGDTVTEAASAGTDTVIADITWTLGSNLENLTLAGTAAINGTGNTLANLIVGNGANNTLSGGSGADTMRGGAGDDTYVVDNAADVVTENAGEGNDLVNASVTYTLSANVERLTLTGTTAINATGNTLDNVLTGNSGANTLTGGAGNDTLNGGSGADTMLGGLGDDVYTVDNASDVVTENAGEGIDLVNSSITLTLAANVEALALSGSSAINGTGNALDNLLRGNTGANTLNGGTGNDVLEGGSGNDTLTDTAGTALFNGGAGTDTITGGASAELYLGGLGNDTFTTAGGNDVILFNKGDGQDTFATGGTGSDTVSLGGGIAYTDLSFSKATNDLVLKTGGTDQITFKNWYAATPSKPVLSLQMIAEAMADFSAGGSDPLRDQKIENFDFAGLVGAFDAARVANPGLTSWALTNALATFQLAGSDTAAMGGDLAYQYGKNGTLAGIGLTAAQQVIGDANFGTQAQTLRPLATIQEGAVRLS